MHAISSTPPAPEQEPKYHSQIEQDYATLLINAHQIEEGLEISEYTRHMIVYLQVGLSKEEAHRMATEKAGLQHARISYQVK